MSYNISSTANDGRAQPNNLLLSIPPNSRIALLNQTGEFYESLPILRIV